MSPLAAHLPSPIPRPPGRQRRGDDATTREVLYLVGVEEQERKHDGEKAGGFRKGEAEDSVREKLA